jgi:hypothetical protein
MIIIPFLWWKISSKDAEKTSENQPSHGRVRTQAHTVHESAVAGAQIHQLGFFAEGPHAVSF